MVLFESVSEDFLGHSLSKCFGWELPQRKPCWESTSSLSNASQMPNLPRTLPLSAALWDWHKSGPVLHFGLVPPLHLNLAGLTLTQTFLLPSLPNAHQSLVPSCLPHLPLILPSLLVTVRSPQPQAPRPLPKVWGGGTC